MTKTGEPVRVLHSTYWMNVGGIETLLMSIYRAIDRSRVQFDFLLNYEGRSFYDNEIEALGGCIYHVPQRVGNPIAARKAHEAFFKEHRDYSIAQFHMGHMGGMLPIKVAKEQGVGTRIIHAHNAHVKLPAVRAALHSLDIPRSKRLCTDFFACSEDAARYFGFDATGPKAWRYVPNGIDCARFSFAPENRAAVRAELGLGDGKPCIGMVGRLEPQKNHKFGIDSFCELVKELPEARLLLVGEGTIEAEIREYVAARGVAGKVTFLGSRHDVERLYAAMDAFLFPSVYEGFGIVLVEAQASGLPCVVSDAIPKEAVICPDTKAIALDAGAGEWARALRDALLQGRNPHGADQVRAAGFDINNVAEELCEFYLSRSGSAASVR